MKSGLGGTLTFLHTQRYAEAPSSKGTSGNDLGDRIRVIILKTVSETSTGINRVRRWQRVRLRIVKEK
jgi:hypothetical protein